MKKKIILFLMILMLFLSSCSSEKAKFESHIVNVTVLKTEKESHWSGKFYTYNYYVYFDVGNGNEWKVNSDKLFNMLKEGDEVSVFKTDIIKDGKIVQTRFEFIN